MKPSQSFPTLVLAALIVAAGIYVVDNFSSRAAWLLAFLVLLTVAFSYQKFGDELIVLFGGKPASQQTAAPTPTPTPKPSPGSIVVGPNGPITA